MFVLTLIAFSSRHTRYQPQPIDDIEDENSMEFDEENGLPDPVLPEPEFEANAVPESHTYMLKLVNQERSKRSLRTLSYSSKLSSIVKVHNDKMIKGTVAFGHDGFNSRAKQSGSSYCGENVAYCYAATWQNAIKQLHDMWMNSSGHRANILNSNFKLFGFAYGVKKVADKYYQCYATQFFAK